MTALAMGDAPPSRRARYPSSLQDAPKAKQA